jgi:hypothetical protein
LEQAESLLRLNNLCYIPVGEDEREMSEMMENLITQWLAQLPLLVERNLVSCSPKLRKIPNKKLLYKFIKNDYYLTHT